MKFKKVFAVLACLAITTSLISGCTKKNENGGGDESENPSVAKELNILTWADYVPGEIVSRFEEETGIRVYYTTFDTNEEMKAKLQAQKNTYDIVICSDYIIDLMRNEDMLEKIDKTKVHNFSNINPIYQGKYFDPNTEYTATYTVSAPIIIYDREKTGFEITGFEDLWNESLTNKVVMVDGSRELLSVTLKTLGYSINETDPAHLDEAKDKLMLLKPNIAKLDANYPHNSMIQGDAIVGFMYGSQAMAALEELPHLEVCYPKEGLYSGSDNIVIPKGSPNLENAHAFMNFLLDGEVSANISTIINYTNTNTAATEFLPQSFLDNKIVNIPKEALETAEQPINLGEADVIYDTIYTEFLGN